MRSGRKKLKIRILGVKLRGLRKSDELKLKGALAELRGFIRAVETEEWYVTASDRETLVDSVIYRPAAEKRMIN